MVVCLLGCEKQQSSLHAPRAQVCNENRSTAITQNLCLNTHREPYMQVFSCIFFVVFVFYFSLYQMRPCNVFGAEGVEGARRGERQKDAGRKHALSSEILTI